MTESARGPLESLLARLADSLGDLAPEPLLNRMRPVMEGFFEQFQLVPKRDYETQVRALERLEARVAELEGRIAELERND